MCVATTWLCYLPDPPAQRRAKEGLAAGDTDPLLDNLSDEEYVFSEEPAELVAARHALAAYTARQGEEEPPGVCVGLRGGGVAMLCGLRLAMSCVEHTQ
jgi:hypothetical protein